MSRLDHVDELLGVLSRYGRIRERLAVTKFKTAEGIVETAAFSCLFTLADQPMRSGELAEHLLADPSTVSRHIAALVRLGYVRREADPRDGRATILVLTDSGRGQVRAVREHRKQVFDEMLGDFTNDEVAELTRLMGRVVVAVEDFAARVHDGDPTHADRAGIDDAPATVGSPEKDDDPDVAPAEFTYGRREKASR
ncbi:MarR family transcriptional regulator [uncultured Williamsia sp.]|uniref:MarR family winged helix-turn-helix transcriptional regulator n=1 Tax=uncultured Williamsia sp. TaxID=259311 RepID=UPI00262ECCFA|nr:MarR family transcriptional regulator [uncultured Williamsia sp.]